MTERAQNDKDDECYCDFASRRFFGCYSREHVPPCPQAKDAAHGEKAASDDHHPWCNYFLAPIDGCRQCADLNQQYPLAEGETLRDLQRRYFPNAKPVSALGERAEKEE